MAASATSAIAYTEYSPGEVGLAGVEVVQRRGAGERAQPPGQALVGGRARCGPAAPPPMSWGAAAPAVEKSRRTD